MKRTLYDHFKDFRLNTIRVLVRIWMFFDFKIKRIYHDGFKPNRKEPYVLLANHTFMFDVVHVQVALRNIPYSIASRILFVRQPTKYLLGTLAHAIPKSKGKADINTAKQIMKAVKKGYPILIYPEGDTTFYGETNYIESSTFKLIKKLKVDVVCVNQKGGYLSRPRWATGKRKNRRAQFDYHITIKKEELKDLSVDEIGERVTKALYNNDYEYQRKAMIKHPGKQLAEGFENGVYICPNCDAINSIETNGNTIKCNSCNTVGGINEYGFIEGFKFDNLVDWDKYQRTFIKQLKASTIESTATLLYSDFETGINELIGQVTLTYKNGTFIFKGATNQEIDINEIKNPTIALRRDLNFTYNDVNYLVKLDKYSASFLRVLQEKY